MTHSSYGCDGVIALHRDETGYLVDPIDQSRVALECDLHDGMGFEHASLSASCR
ncbi:hypothetical protein [Hyphomicrobium sp.]|uniref:hypothetical protein n=1 Tax=Hyphomicrobium sp. TaxID=82 RepID=UPI003F70F8D2